MSRFQTDFRGVDNETQQRLHAELWELFSTRVRELVRAGKTEEQAMKDAGPYIETTFNARHPEMRGKWAFRVLGP